jgi:hypothetical protein
LKYLYILGNILKSNPPIPYKMGVLGFSKPQNVKK